MKRTTNKDCGELVEKREAFNGAWHPRFTRGTIFARWHGNVYVVYSYGDHYPMFLWIPPDKPDGGWYENSDGYSRSTSKHHSNARPLAANIIQHASTQDLKDLIYRYIRD